MGAYPGSGPACITFTTSGSLAPVFQEERVLMRRYWSIGAIAGSVVLADQVSKQLAMDAVPLWRSVPVIDGFFNLVHVQNRGAAFGFLNREDTDWQFYFFAVVTFVAVLVLFYLAKTAKERSHLLFTSLGLILSGAIGNFIDRCRFRHVVDFLDFHIGEWHWPAFNVADIAITCGVILMLLNMLCSSRRKD